jgi:hypothetical protein
MPPQRKPQPWQVVAALWNAKVARARTSLAHFIELAVKDDHGVGIKLAPIHMSWIRHLNYCWTRELRCMTLAPFGHGKSSSLLVPLCAYMIGQDPNLRIKIITNDDDSASKRVGAVKRILESVVYRQVFPDVVSGGAWTGHELYVKRVGHAVDPTVQARGIFTTGIGGRCILPGTLVYAPGGAVPISDIRPKDRVLTSAGKYEFVSAVSVKDFSGEAVSLGVEGFNRPIEMTPEHQVLTYQNLEFKWVRADSLKKRDYVVLPRMKACSSHRMYTDPIKMDRAKSVLCNSGTWRLFGYYLGDGWLKDPVGTGKRGSSNSVWFAFNNVKGEDEYVEDLREIASDIGATFTAKPRNSCMEVRVCHPAIAMLCRELGSGWANKRIPYWVERASGFLQREVLKGLWRADGHEMPTMMGIVGANEALMRQVQMMFFGLGARTCMSLIREPGVVHRLRGKDCVTNGLWGVQSNDCMTREIVGADRGVRPGREMTRSYFLPDHVLLRIRTVGRRQYSGPVYDLTVPSAGNFATVGAIVHNCDIELLDDVVDQKNSMDPIQRRRVLSLLEETWFSRLEPDGNMLAIGTTWHQDDALHHLMHRPRWCTLRQSISDDCTEVEQTVVGARDDYPDLLDAAAV